MKLLSIVYKVDKYYYPLFQTYWSYCNPGKTLYYDVYNFKKMYHAWWMLIIGEIAHRSERYRSLYFDLSLLQA